MKHLLILILIMFPAFFSMLRPGYYIMHDDMQMIRQLQMEKCFQDGQIPCRWGPDLGYGYGYPIFNFYPPLPYLIGQLTRFVGYTFVDTVKINAILQFLLAGIGMYLLTKRISDKNTALISSVLYTYAPYHFNNLYIRGAFNEAWASAFFPFILLYLYELVQKTSLKHILLLALSISGVLLSHNPMAILYAPFCFLILIFWLIQKKTLTPAIPIFISSLFGLGFSAFFTLPVLFETKYVQIETMFTNYYSYLAHFTSIKQLFFTNFWGNGPSFFGPKDAMSFQLGFFHWIITVLGLVYVLVKKVFSGQISKNGQLFFLLSIFAFLSLFLTHERSAPIWEKLSLLQKVQFPWRWLNVSTFFFSLSSSLAIFELTKIKTLRYFGFFVLLLIIFTNFLYASPIQHGPLTDSEKFSGKAWNNLITSGIYDYLPKTARIAPLGPAGGGIDEIKPENTINSLNIKSGSDWNLISVDLKKPSQVYLSRLDFPGTKVYINTQLVEHSYEPELGRIKLDLNSGQNLIYVKLENTPIREISNVITLTTLLLAGISLIWKPNPKSIFKK